MEAANEVQETLGRSYNLPDDIDEDDLEAGKLFISIMWRYGILRRMFRVGCFR